MEFLLARHLLRQIELSANLSCGIKQGHPVATLRRDRRIGEARRTRPHHGNGFRLSSGLVVQQGFMTSPGIDQAGGGLEVEGVVETGLVAGDTGVDFIGAPLIGFHHELAVSQHGSRHGNQVCIAGRQHRFRHLRHVDAIGSDHGYGHLLAHPVGHAGEGGSGYHGRDGRHLGFMPGKVCGDDTDASPLKLPGQLGDLLPTHPTLQHIHGRDAKDHYKIIAHSLAHPSHHGEGEAHPVFITPAPLVAALIGLFHQEGR